MRRYFILLLCMGILGVSMIYYLLPAPQCPHGQCNPEFFHQLIEPCPPLASMCGGSVTEEALPDQATYRLEVRIVEIPFGKPHSAIPPLSGYLTDINFFQFMEGVQGDIRCSIWQWPASTISNEQPATFNNTPVKIQLKKTNDHFELKYTQASGITYTQDFDLPEGVAFATNLGEHRVLDCRYHTGPRLPLYFSFLDPLFTETVPLQREMFLLVKYHEIEVEKKR